MARLLEMFEYFNDGDGVAAGESDRRPGFSHRQRHDRW